MNTKNESVSFAKELFQWIEAILVAVIIALLIRGFIFEPVLVQGDSMNNTLSSNERLIVYKLGYYFSEPKRGDIIVLQYQKGAVEYIPFLKNFTFIKKMLPGINEVDFIKRVIAVPGDVVDIKDGFVYINNEKLDEPYALGYTDSYGLKVPFVVEEGEVFVLGDNRQNSRDSRQIGMIKYDRIKGKAVYRIWPLNNMGVLK
ncbi:MAG TPA: signal peptidase I [Clostridiaceae bacterium]|nr:signal peptidase I [Clostridiaceae bacterium]